MGPDPSDGETVTPCAVYIYAIGSKVQGLSVLLRTLKAKHSQSDLAVVNREKHQGPASVGPALLSSHELVFMAHLWSSVFSGLALL